MEESYIKDIDIMILPNKNPKPQKKKNTIHKNWQYKKRKSEKKWT